MRISDWSSDVCSSDLGGASQLAISPELAARLGNEVRAQLARQPEGVRPVLLCSLDVRRHLRKLMEVDFFDLPVLSYQELAPDLRIEIGRAHVELQSLMRISYAVFCLKKKKNKYLQTKKPTNST